MKKIMFRINHYLFSDFEFSGKELSCVIDTGANKTLIPKWHNIKREVIGPGPRIKYALGGIDGFSDRILVSSIKSNDFKVNNIEILEKKVDIPKHVKGKNGKMTFSGIDNFDILPIIGTDIFKGKVININDDKKTIFVANDINEFNDTDKKNTINIINNEGYIVVIGYINNKKCKILVDTGVVNGGVIIGTKSGITVSGSNLSLQICNKKMDFEKNKVIKSIDADYCIVGYEIFRRCRFGIIDFKNKKMLIQ